MGALARAATSAGRLIAQRSDRLRAAGPLLARISGWPGVRTLRSPRFRLAIGLSLSLIGLVVLGALMDQQIRDPHGGFGIDFADYRAASLRMLDGGSPYAPEMLVGPIPAQGTDRYRYPPVFAQLMTPLAILPPGIGAIVWAALQGVLVFAATWAAASASGARPSLARLVWTGVAVIYFLPVFATLWTGNVDGVIAASVGALVALPMGQHSRRQRAAGLVGLLAGATAVFKLTPIAFLPALLRRGGRLAGGAVAGIAALVLFSLLSAPHAWAEYAQVLPNLVAGSADYANNLSPAAVALRLGAPVTLAEAIRALMFGMALGLVVVSLRSAGTPAGWPAAIACAATASLLVPAALWYHYLTILLPLAAFAWMQGGVATRAMLGVSGVIIAFGLALPPVATLGAAVLATTLLLRLAPRGMGPIRAEPTAGV